MRKKPKLKIINSLEVSSPCHSDNFASHSTETKTGWYCGECKKDVHDLSKYTQKDILKLIDESKGNFCALIKRKADGSVITKEPPSYSRALLATGVLLASTVLHQEEAAAQVGGITSQEMSDQNQYHELGKIAVAPSVSPTPEPSPSLIESNDTPIVPIDGTCEEVSTPEIAKPGLVIIDPQTPTPIAHTRGKVRYVPKTKKN